MGKQWEPGEPSEVGVVDPLVAPSVVRGPYHPQPMIEHQEIEHRVEGRAGRIIFYHMRVFLRGVVTPIIGILCRTPFFTFSPRRELRVNPIDKKSKVGG